MHSGIEVLRKFFADSQPLSTQELKALSTEERQELADLAAQAMGLARVEHEGKISYRAA